MLDAALKTQLSAYLEKLQQPIELVATLDASAAAQDMRRLLADLAALSPKVAVREDGQDARRPSFSVGLPGTAARIRFAGLPLGHEFTSLVLALLQTGGHPPRVEPAVIEQIRALPVGQQGLRFETYISLSCHNCPDIVQALNLLAVLNPGIEHTMIDGALAQDEVAARKIMAVPTIYLNGEVFGQGRMALEDILAKLDTGSAAREAATLADKAPYDVLVVGGGPAGAAAAIYAARKGVRTGIVAERFGGQVLDTLAIENFISVPATEGPKLAGALEQHVLDYDVDLMNRQRAAGLVPGADGLTEIRLENGAVLRSKTVILSTGARWRELGVPGEREYRGRGVAYCPHCDGPLFKGKRVAVVGGGNSGVEAAIDLAGVVGHVTLLTRNALRADAVLQKRLRSLANVTIIEHAAENERYIAHLGRPLAPATDDTRILTTAALRLVDTLYRPGYAYAKAGVLLSELCPRRPRQPDLFAAPGPSPASARLMQTLDGINARWGRDTLRLAAEGTTQAWQMKRAHLSPRYTTDWKGLPAVRAG